MTANGLWKLKKKAFIKFAMYPKDNIFNIYYNIGRRTPFQVKRSRSLDVGFRYNTKGKTFMVEKVEPRGKYGKAFGYCLIDNVRNDEYMKEVYPDNQGEIPCAGCGEWVLVDIPNVDINEVFPVHKPDDVLKFGQHKGETIADVYKKDAKYIFWLLESDPYYKIDFHALLGIDPEDEKAQEKFERELERIFPKVKVEDAISFGKYKGQTYKEVFEKDPQYIKWFLRNNQTVDLDEDSFRELISQK